MKLPIDFGSFIYKNICLWYNKVEKYENGLPFQLIKKYFLLASILESLSCIYNKRH